MSTRSVLIVDDSPILRRAVRRAVQQAGVGDSQIREASNGAEALALFEALDIALVLLDLHMPVLDGVGFLRELNARQQQNKADIVIVSTESNQARLDEVRALGARDVLRKPFEPEQIREYVRKLEV
jgi:two-component system chemotaxis response regulator CheY